MVEPSRYNVKGSNEKILSNKLNIEDPKVLEDIETILLNDTYIYFLEQLKKGKLKLNLQLLFDIHKYFLSTIYAWAGEIRTVDISKNNVLFCRHLNIQRSLNEFQTILSQNIPSEQDDKKNISQKLAIIHCELNVIHPFREGNGRSIRLFLDLLALNCGYKMINYKKFSKKDYFSACNAGTLQDYSPMQSCLFKGLSK